MDPGDLLRAVRYSRRLSQRELARLAGVRRTTVDRIESGSTHEPSLRIVESILQSVAYRLVVADQHGRPLRLEADRFRYWDRGGRHLPAHLERRAINSFCDPWWGWSRLAWWVSDPKVPAHTYDLRNRAHWDKPEFVDRRWDEAT